MIPNGYIGVRWDTTETTEFLDDSNTLLFHERQEAATDQAVNVFGIDWSTRVTVLATMARQQQLFCCFLHIKFNALIHLNARGNIVVGEYRGSQWFHLENNVWDSKLNADKKDERSPPPPFFIIFIYLFFYLIFYLIYLI